MDDQERQLKVDRKNKVSAELKDWEHDFQKKHGRKPTKEEVRDNKKIEGLYKEYHTIKDLLEGKVKPVPESKSLTPKKRRHGDADGKAPKRHRIVSAEEGHDVRPAQKATKHERGLRTPKKLPFTPSKKQNFLPLEEDDEESPSKNWIKRITKIGPTPQRDGYVLGLFDIIEDDGTINTPSKHEKLEQEKASQLLIPSVQKTALGEKKVEQSSTPSGRVKHISIDFTTPSKNKTSNGEEQRTPSTGSKTPAFLKRHSQRSHLPTVDENDEDALFRPRGPRKPFGFSLSNMAAKFMAQKAEVAEAKRQQMEDKNLDEELDILHEIEQEEAGPSIPKAKPASKPVPKPEPAKEAVEAVLVPDSQVSGLLGGFDDEAQLDSDPEDPTNRDGPTLKTYKKKGQKRTTRRSKLKPTTTKATPHDVHPESDSEPENPSSPSIVPETQLQQNMKAFPEARNFDSDSQSEYTASEGGTRYRRPNQQKKKNVAVNKDGRIKKAARKVKQAAHENFKRLKLRNTGAKGGPAHNSRFRRSKK